MEKITKTAMITVCGRPNVGKSSLTNALVGEKIAIVSDKPQTTRNRIYGVVNRDGTQYVLLDTPGLHKPRSRLGDYMVKVVRESLSDVECALLLVEPIAHVGEPERVLLQRIQEEHLPCVLCINKIDTVEKKEALLEVIAAYSEAYDGFDAIIPISARTGDGLDDLMAQLAKYAQEGPQLFPDDHRSGGQPGVRRDRAGEDAAVSGQGDPPRHGGGGDAVHRAGGQRHYRPGRDHLLREGQPQGHYHRQGRRDAQAHQLPGAAGHREVHGYQGVHGDVGKGQGKLAGQCEFYPQPGV